MPEKPSTLCPGCQQVAQLIREAFRLGEMRAYALRKVGPATLAPDEDEAVERLTRALP